MLVKLKELSETLKEAAISNGEVIAKLQHPIPANLVTKYTYSPTNPETPIRELAKHENSLGFYSISLFDDDARFILEHKQGFISRFRTSTLPSNQFYAFKDKLATTEKFITIEQLYTTQVDPEILGGQTARQVDRHTFFNDVVTHALEKHGEACKNNKGDIVRKKLARCIQTNWPIYYDMYEANGYSIDGLSESPPSLSSLDRHIKKFT